MDDLERERLKRKLSECQSRIKNSEVSRQKNFIAESVGSFYEKYRFADERETSRLNAFIRKLDFLLDFPQSEEESGGITPCKMYVCFLQGVKEIFNIYIFGNYGDIIKDIDEWLFFSSRLLFVSEDLSYYIYMNDKGEIRKGVENNERTDS